jgi:hypothetical protein
MDAAALNFLKNITFDFGAFGTFDTFDTFVFS